MNDHRKMGCSIGINLKFLDPDLHFFSVEMLVILMGKSENIIIKIRKLWKKDFKIDES